MAEGVDDEPAAVRLLEAFPADAVELEIGGVAHGLLLPAEGLRRKSAKRLQLQETL
jgi:hypothetical protein